jgi:[citrate (pro-3S)-lyase] ligase
MHSYISGKVQLDEAVSLLKSADLDFDPVYDIIIGIYEYGKLTAVGARDRNILKMIAVDEEYRNTGAFSEIIQVLITDAFQAGYDHLFVFTKPIYSVHFESLNFSLLCATEKTAVFEFGKSISKYLSNLKNLSRQGRNAGLVMNCNPFTLGHRYLIEKAASESEFAYVFVVQEDQSVVPYLDRLELVRKGTADLKNVYVIPSGEYAVSRITFPSYFLKNQEQITAQQIEIDLRIFGTHFAPAFNIAKRYVGQEPICQFTSLYNKAMEEIMPEYGIKLIEIERKLMDGNIISASFARRLFFEEKYEEMKRLVPEATYEYLIKNRTMLVERINRFGAVKQNA